MRFQIGAMSVGDILDRGLKLLLARLPTFFLINLIVQIPLLLLALVTGLASEEVTRAGNMVPLFLSLLLLILGMLVLPQIGTGAVLHVITQEFIGKRIGVGEAFRVGFARFWSLLGGSLVFGLICGLGFFCFCIPGVILFCWFALYSQVIVVEGLGPLNSLSRSMELTEGFRLRLFGMFILFVILFGIIKWSEGVVLNQLFPPDSFVQTPFGPIPQYNPGTQAIHAILSFPLDVLLTTYWSVCMTLFYFDLRIRKEGFDLELVAQQQASGMS